MIHRLASVALFSLVVSIDALAFNGHVHSSHLAPIKRSLPVSTDDTCGKSVNKMCPNSSCCSQYGWCGVGDVYCGTGCQSGYGNCGSSVKAASTTKASSSTSAKTSATAVSSGSSSYPVSTNGQCGSDVKLSCPSDQCCSAYGWCGGSAANSKYGTQQNFCGAGCQVGFGRCYASGTTTTPSASSSTPSSSSTCSSFYKGALYMDSGSYPIGYYNADSADQYLGLLSSTDSFEFFSCPYPTSYPAFEDAHAQSDISYGLQPQTFSAYGYLKHSSTGKCLVASQKPGSSQPAYLGTGTSLTRMVFTDCPAAGATSIDAAKAFVLTTGPNGNGGTQHEVYFFGDGGQTGSNGKVNGYGLKTSSARVGSAFSLAVGANLNAVYMAAF